MVAIVQECKNYQNFCKGFYLKYFCSIDIINTNRLLNIKCFIKCSGFSLHAAHEFNVLQLSLLILASDNFVSCHHYTVLHRDFMSSARIHLQSSYFVLILAHGSQLQVRCKIKDQILVSINSSGNLVEIKWVTGTQYNNKITNNKTKII